MDVLTLSRIQFALNIGFHYLFPPMSIGLGLMLVFLEGLYLKTKDEKYREMAVFWTKIFALTFAMGVATGLVQTFAFGTNWSRFSRYVGDVFGSALASEGIFAFFLESGFLGVMLFGQNRIGPKLHYFSTICVCLGAHFSAVWIIVADSWMHTPAGFRIEATPLGDRAVITDFWQMVFNPSSVDRLVHVILGCWLTGAFFVISAAAYYILKKRDLSIARPMMRFGLLAAAVLLALQVISGDRSGKLIAKYQPAKLAAFEGLYKTQAATPASIAGWVDSKEEKVYSLKIPKLLSFLIYGNDDPVVGLDRIPRDEWPNVPIVFQAYHAMLLSWGLMVAVVGWGLWNWRKKAFEERPVLLKVLIGSVVLPHLSQQAGWMAAEMGRQPWVVWKLLRTSDAVSVSIRANQVLGSIFMFAVIYLLLFALFLFLLDRQIRRGLSEESVSNDEKLYRDPYGGSP